MSINNNNIDRELLNKFKQASKDDKALLELIEQVKVASGRQGGFKINLAVATLSRFIGKNEKDAKFTTRQIVKLAGKDQEIQSKGVAEGTLKTQLSRGFSKLARLNRFQSVLKRDDMDRVYFSTEQANKRD